MFDACYDSAITVYKKAGIGFEALKDWEGVADCWNRIGDSFKEKARYDSAIDYSRRALELALNKLGDRHFILMRIYNSISFVYWEKAEYDTTWTYCNKALAIPHSENDPDIAQTFFCLGQYYRAKGNYDKALENHRIALNIRLNRFGYNHSETAQSYHAIGMINIFENDYDEAFKQLRNALEIKEAVLKSNHPNLAVSFDAIGRIYSNKNDLTAAYNYFNRALDLALKAFGNLHPNVALYYENIGYEYLKMGDFYRSADFFQKALSIRINVFDENHVRNLHDYKMIGISYQLNGNYGEAMKYYERALTLSMKLFESDALNTADCYAYFASMHSSMGNNDKAIEYWNKVLKIALKIEAPNSFSEAYCYRCLGTEYDMKKDYEEALKYYYKALSIYTKYYKERKFKSAEVLNDIGGAYLKQFQYETALSWIQKAMNMLVYDFNDTNIYSNPPLKNIVRNGELLISLKLKAECLEKFYLLQPNNLTSLQKALETYELIIELTDKIRQNYKSEGSKLDLGSKTNRAYENAIRTSLALYNQTQNESYKIKAFTLAEKSKTAVLLEALSDLKAKSFASIPDSLLERENILRIDLAFYETQIQKEMAEHNDSAKIQKLQNKVFGLKYDYESLIRNYETNYPEYHKLKYELKIVSIDEIQLHQLEKDQVVVEYFIGEDSIFIYAISTNRFQIYSVSKDSSLELLVKNFRKSLLNLDPDGYIDTASKLYHWLIQPVASEIKGYRKLIIVPDGILNYLPFEALLTTELKSSLSPDFTKLPYLINDFQISYYYSLTLLARQSEGTQMANSFLGIAPVFTDSVLSEMTAQSSMFDTTSKNIYPDLMRSISVDGKTFASLPYSETELKDIDALFVRHNLTSKTLLHGRATKMALKSEKSSRYKFIHIASHGFINESNPQLSGIIFSPIDSNEGGILYASEIYNLPLKADLVVLSACESGLGKIVKGEGIMSLTRGFIYSGARNVIVSLWQVRDRSAAVLMKLLYEKILNGQSYSEAAQQAKIEMIRDPKYAYPLDWSSFVLIGR